MFDLLKSLISAPATETRNDALDLTDPQLCCAALLVHVLSADGVVKPEEEGKLREIVSTQFDLNANEAEKLYTTATKATAESVDLYTFTSTLKRNLSEEQRITLVGHLWQIVYADGQMHEMEDNVVWRIAELLAVSSRDRMLAKQDVARNHQS